MIKTKKIIDVEPFNEVFYKTCTYNPLLSAVYYFGGSINPFLANDMFVYGYNDDTDEGVKIWRKNIQIKTEEQVFNDMGLSMDTNFKSNDYINEIKQSIIDKKPVFLTIDRYYWENKINTVFYKTSHWPHYFLVKGFDDEQRRFIVIDADTQSCNELDIDYDNLSLSYQEGDKRKDEFMYVPMCKIYPVQSNTATTIELDEIKAIFTENLRTHKNEIEEGIENIKKSVTYYDSCHNNHSLILDQDRERIAQNFFFFEQAKKVELYRALKFFKDDLELINLMKSIVTVLGINRGLFIKIIASKRNVDNIIGMICNKLDSLYEMETRFNEIMFNKLGV